MTLSSWLQESFLTNGVVALYKPYGMPSTAIVELYKRALHEKVGHGGTLDPLAEGRLVLGIGKGTKLLQKYLEGTKVYTAEFLMGASSVSEDLETEVQYEQVIPQITANDIESTLETFSIHGFIQKITTFSAIKKAGKASFKEARKGDFSVVAEKEAHLLKYKLHNFERLTNNSVINLLESKKEALNSTRNEFIEIGEQVGYYLGNYAKLFEKWDANISLSMQNIHGATANLYCVSVTVTVPKGTYVRAFITALAEKLGTRAVLVRLIRKESIANE